MAYNLLLTKEKIMSVSSWSPSATKPLSTDGSTVENLLNLIDNISSLDVLTKTVSALSVEEVNSFIPLMKQPAEFWQELCADFSLPKLKNLIFFFTFAEDQFAVLEAGNNSPVIAINKLLKAQKTPLSKDELLWIKSHSRNHYLPNGSVF
jgi:hypothetical protein